MKLPSKKTIIRSLMFIISVGIILYFLPRKNERQFLYEVNRPWSYSLLTAPFDIPIQLDSIRANEVKDSINNVFIPVYKRNNDESKAAIDAYSLALNANQSVSIYEKAKLINALKEIYNNGIVDLNTYNAITSGKLSRMRFIEENRIINKSTNNLLSARKAYTTIDSLLKLESLNTPIASTELSKFLAPNILYDSIESNRLYQDICQKAMAPIGIIQNGERIIDRGEKVTPQLYTILQTYEQMLLERKANKHQQIYPVLGQLLFVIILLSALFYYLYFMRNELFANTRAMLFIMLMVVGFAVFSVAMKNTFANGLYLVPFTIIAIMMVVFFDSRTALFCLIIETMLCSCIANVAFEFIFVQFIAGVTAIYSLKELTRRSQLIQTALLVFTAYSLSYIAVEVISSGTISGIDLRIFGIFAINSVLISFAYILIFVFEKLFGFTSIVTLVELSDINNPLLRELSEECPGTFQHSLSVSNLAYEAAHRIGANAQLVRAGALYHDIGKITNPAFFTENQHGVNPHDALNPLQSARIVIAHVTDGLKRAEKAKLPSVIKNFISEHHGCGKAKYFYNTYCNQHPDEEVDTASFIYPGPNPQSKETSILMMADTVEAASRSLPDHTPEAIENLVNRLIDSQIADGLHNDSLLSFKDVREIKESFISRLRTMYHARISYPSDPTKK
ncbi:MAG: HDIG domain-containing protein [Muribaculaceae bacterium]|nr:HDIG domain-containing protein [Muribaculaceae bacterium]